MPTPRDQANRSLLTTLALVAPTVAVLILLALDGELAWGHVLTATGAVAVAVFFLVRRFLFEMTAVIVTAEALAENDQRKITPPKLSGRLSADALAAVLRLDRAWRERASALRGGVGENKGVFDSLPDPLILLDARRRVIFGNAAARQLLGTITVGADLALALRDPAVLEAVDGVLEDGAGRQADFHSVEPSERDFAARVEKLRISRNDDEVANGAVCVLAMIDVTAVKRVEQMRADFIANASHELRTPLSSLIGFIETLQGPARDDAKAREQFLKLMHEQAQRMARLVRDLMSLSIIEMGEHNPPAGEVEVPALLQTVIAVLQLQARDKGIAVKLKSETANGKPLPRVPGESDQLAQLFQNLIDNAIKYGARDSEVTVRVWQTAAPPALLGAKSEAEAASRAKGRAMNAGDLAIPPQTLAVSVSDKGDGIAQEHLPRLTERFYRVDTARSRAVGGTGLGLAIVKHIVARHRGHLRIESEPGQGSIFTVFLPLERAVPAADKPIEPEKVPS